MRIAVLSDIHSNEHALRACLDRLDALAIDHYVFLGDYLGELAWPERTMALLRALAQARPCTFIRGNKEDYWLDRAAGQGPAWRLGSSTTGALAYVYPRVTAADLAFFRGLPVSLLLRLPGVPPLMLCHGSPDSARGKLLPGHTPAAEALAASPAEVLLCGHTHRPFAWAQGARQLLNPGAVGVSLDGRGGHASCLLLDSDGGPWQPHFLLVPYDVEAACHDLIEAGLTRAAPGWTRAAANLLRRGGPSMPVVLARVTALAQRQGGCWPELPEACWAQALSELGIP